jgi:hypothetical protein
MGSMVSFGTPQPLTLRIIGVSHSSDRAGINIMHASLSHGSPADPLRVRGLQKAFCPYSQNLKQSIIHAVDQNDAVPTEVAMTNAAFSDFVTQSVRSFVRQHRLGLASSIDLIGIEGPVLAKTGCAKHEHHSATPEAFLELGNLTIVAASTGATTVGSFRCAHKFGHGSFRLPAVTASETSNSGDSLDPGVRAAFYACEAFVGRPLLWTVDADACGEAGGVVGHIRPGSNYFELRRAVVQSWGDWPVEDIVPTAEIILET